MSRLRGPVIGAVAVGAIWWWVVSGSSVGSPVRPGQDAVVTPGGLAALADNVQNLDGVLRDQRAGLSVTGAEMMDRGMVPLEPGTRVRMLELGWDGVTRTAHVRVLQANGLTGLAVLGNKSLQGWTFAQWLVSQ